MSIRMTHNNPHTRPLRNAARLVGWTAFGGWTFSIVVIHIRTMGFLAAAISYAIGVALFAAASAILSRVKRPQAVLDYNPDTGEWSSPTGHHGLAAAANVANLTPDDCR